MQTRALGKSGVNVGAVGLGGMYLSITGRPPETDAVKTIAAALDAGVTLIDTADVYCLDQTDIGHNERLIAQALKSRRDGVIVATKGGLERPNGAWTRNARPEALQRACERSLKALEVDVIDVYQLHAPDPAVPFESSVEALAELQRAQKVKHVALSNVSVEQIRSAQRIVPIVSVQNKWNPAHREPERDGVLDYCAENRIAFLPYSPFGGASGAKGLSTLGRIAEVAKAKGVSPHRLVIAWMLAKSPAVIPIPGARRIESIVDSAAAAEMTLTPQDVAEVEAAFPSG